MPCPLAILDSERQTTAEFRLDQEEMTPRTACGSWDDLGLRSVKTTLNQATPRRYEISIERSFVMPVVLTTEIRELVNNGLASGNPLLLAAVAPDSKPVLSFRGSTQVYSDGQLDL
jgi:hypothetical protein